MNIQAKTEKDRLFLYHLAKLCLFDDNFSISAENDENCVKVLLTDSDRKFTGTSYINKSIHYEEKRAYTVSLGKAFFQAVSTLPRKRVPYGTLTGVRPVKVPLFYLNKGKNQDEVISILQNEYCVFPEKAKLLTLIAQKEAKYSFDKKDFILYISIPFCPSRCNYCSFVSQKTEKESIIIDEYIDTILFELEESAKIAEKNGLNLKAVYIGGGTPGILSKDNLEKTVCRIKSLFKVSPDCEFTVEMGRPDTITEEKLNVLFENKIRRICINPQTTSDSVLNEIGRRHTNKDFLDAIKTAKSFNYFSINSDLIAGLSSDTPDGFINSVKEVISLGPESITLHALCKKNAARLEKIPDKQGFYEAMQYSHSLMFENGYTPYYLYRQKSAAENLENTGFAKPGEECIYNILMMEDISNVISVGAGAVSKVIRKTESGYDIKRFYAYKYPLEYIKDTEKIKNNILNLNNAFQE